MSGHVLQYNKDKYRSLMLLTNPLYKWKKCYSYFSAKKSTVHKHLRIHGAALLQDEKAFLNSSNSLWFTDRFST